MPLFPKISWLLFWEINGRHDLATVVKRELRTGGLWISFLVCSLPLSSQLVQECGASSAI